MAYSTFSVAPDMTSDATFRAWGSAISAALTAVGLAMTADTGQINWTTVTKPATQNTFAGYEIRAFTTLSGNPIYFKIEYGAADNAAGRPGIRITYGNGSNGSGTITGNTYTTPNMGALNSTTAMTCMVSSDGHYLSVALWFNATSGNTSCMLFGAGRTKDDSGAHTSDGLNVFGHFSSTSTVNTRYQTFLPKNGSGLATERKGGDNIFHTAAPPTGTGTYGTTLGQWPLFVSRGAADNTCMTAIAVFPADHGGAAAAGSVIECLLYGVTHYYLFVGQLSGTQALNGNTNNNNLAMRYE
jgi:hypothetical protein